MRKYAQGMTLIEVMVVVVIVSVLAAMAYPSYLNYIRKARRADGLDALLYLQTQQEKWRANNTTYGTAAQIGAGATSDRGFYTITVAGNTGTAFTLTATAIGDQANDTGCTPLTLTVTAAAPRGVKAPASCWN